jgi:hypothetical protein
MANKSFENVAKFRYLRMTGTDLNLIHKEIKRRLMRVTLDTLQLRMLRFLVCYLKV